MRQASKIARTDVPVAALRGQRVALSAIFAVHGFTYASWAVRIPAVRQQTGASAAALGLALLGLSAGAVATMLIAGAFCRRLGSRQLTVLSCALLSLTLLLPPLAHSAFVLGLALLVFGAAYGCLNVAMNSVAVDLVAAMDRPVMPAFHAAWSFGGLAGAGIGGLIAPHLSALPHLVLACVAGLVITIFAGRTLLAPVPEAITSGLADGPASTALPEPGRFLASAWARVLSTGRLAGVLGLIALCAAYDEGAVGDWGSLHLRQDLGAGAGLAAAGYAAFALAEAIGRLSGTALLERHGRTRVLVAGGLTACGGMLVAALAPDVWPALAGFAATGLGLANLFPVAVADAGMLAGSAGVALTSTLGYGGFLLGPPAIGFLASDFGLPAGLTTLSFLACGAAVIAYLTADRLPCQPELWTQGSSVPARWEQSVTPADPLISPDTGLRLIIPRGRSGPAGKQVFRIFEASGVGGACAATPGVRGGLVRDLRVQARSHRRCQIRLLRGGGLHHRDLSRPRARNRRSRAGNVHIRTLRPAG